MGDVYIKGHTRTPRSFIRHGLQFGQGDTYHYVTEELANVILQEPALDVRIVPESEVPEHEKAAPGAEAKSRPLSPGEQAILAEEARKRQEEQARTQLLSSEAAQKQLEQQSKSTALGAQPAPPPQATPASNDRTANPPPPGTQTVGVPLEGTPPVHTDEGDSSKHMIGPSSMPPKTKR